MPLHSKTLQALISPMHGPSPSIPTDAESIPRVTNHNLKSYVQQTAEYIENAKTMLE
jgi:hypothetical protein